MTDSPTHVAACPGAHDLASYVQHLENKEETLVQPRPTLFRKEESNSRLVVHEHGERRRSDPGEEALGIEATPPPLQVNTAACYCCALQVGCPCAKLKWHCINNQQCMFIEFMDNQVHVQSWNSDNWINIHCSNANFYYWFLSVPLPNMQSTVFDHQSALPVTLHKTRVFSPQSVYVFSFCVVCTPCSLQPDCKAQ
jgi:hypothetical protein